MNNEILELLSFNLNIDICSLKVGEIYKIKNEIYKIIVPYKVYEKDPRLCFGLSKYIGDTNVIGNVKR